MPSAWPRCDVRTLKVTSPHATSGQPPPPPPLARPRHPLPPYMWWPAVTWLLCDSAARCCSDGTAQCGGVHTIISQQLAAAVACISPPRLAGTIAAPRQGRSVTPTPPGAAPLNPLRLAARVCRAVRVRLPCNCFIKGGTVHRRRAFVAPPLARHAPASSHGSDRKAKGTAGNRTRRLLPRLLAPPRPGGDAARAYFLFARWQRHQQQRQQPHGYVLPNCRPFLVCAPLCHAQVGLYPPPPPLPPLPIACPPVVATTQ